MKKITEELSRRMATMSFVCACLIVALHSTPRPDVQTWQWWFVGVVGKEGLCRIAVPWFFLASGFFLANHFGAESWYRQEVGKRVRSLIVPFFVWTIIGKIISLLAWWGAKLMGRECGFKYPFEGGLGYSFLTMVGVNPFANVGVVWYMRAVFILVVISPLIYFAVKKWGWAVPLVLFLGCGLYCTFVYFSNVWDYFISIRGLAYFTIGAAIRMGAFRTVHAYLHHGKVLVPILGSFLLLLKLITWRNGMEMLGNLFDFLMVVPLMLLVWQICKYIRLPKMCIVNSFALYLMHSHFLFLSIAIMIVIGLQDILDGSVVVFALRWLFSVLVSLMLAELMKRYFPKVSGFLFGGR